MQQTRLILAILAVYCFTNSSSAHTANNTKLHVGPKWDECSFQLHPSLTQKAWHQFTQEAALVTYFRPLIDAKPMGVGRYELSILQWETAIDSKDEAWNNTFVHPDSTHWLFEGPRLAFPGLTFRTGITDKIDVGAYWTENFGANYGFYGAQVQYNIVDNEKKSWAAAARASFVSIYGPSDLNFSAYGFDLLTSKTFALYADWLSVSPYAGVSTCFSHAHEKTDAVDLKNENVLSVRGTLGTVAQISVMRLGIEYNLAKVNSLSFKLGVNFKIGSKS
jgi:hypothetical protein